jgi:hypothetical protein
VWFLNKQAIPSIVTMDTTDTTSIKVKTMAMVLSFNNRQAHISVVAKMFINHRRDHRQERKLKGMESFGKLMDATRQMAKFLRGMTRWTAETDGQRRKQVLGGGAWISEGIGCDELNG